MSRTLKDAPGARTARADRRFAEREIPLPARREAVPSDPWESFADPGLSVEARLAAAEWLGLAGLPTDAQLAAAPCPDEEQHAGILTLAVDNPDPDECDVVRAELTAVANNW